MTDEKSEHGRRVNAWRYGEGTMWGQTKVWITGAGDVIPVENLEPSHLANIIRGNARGDNADVLEGTPLMRRLRQLQGGE